MKKVLIAVGLILLSPMARANVADTVCTVTGTSLQFDLASSTPMTEGSRFFAELMLYSSATPNAAPFYDIKSSPDYDIAYADGVLQDGANYFMVSIASRSTGSNFYAFSRDKSATNAAYTTIYSTFPNFSVPLASSATFTCE